MRRTGILQTVLLVAIVGLLAGCYSGRTYRTYPPPPPPPVRANVSLIISPFPGIVISAHPDGRYYYRSPQGYMYWRGYDNRYYLDRQYLGRFNYDRREYNEWRRYRNYRGNYRRRW